MTWLYIDTRQKETAHIIWLSDKQKMIKREARGRGKAILKAIERDWEMNAPSLEGVILVAGPGSFSSIRTGVLYANLFSRFLGLPLYRLSGTNEWDMQEVLIKVKNGQLEKEKYIEPIYDREPNITTPKT